MHNCAQNATIYSILMTTLRYIDPVGDISTFKRYFHRILHAECFARQFHCRNNQICEKCDHLLDSDDKLSVISLLLEIFRRLNAISIAFYTPNAIHAVFGFETIRPV